MTTLRIRKSLAAVAIGASAMTAVAAPAVAVVQVGGGSWDYGVNAFWNWSNYYHPNNNHRSSVETSGIVHRSACTSPGNWSHVQTVSALSGNSAYWNNSCS